MDWNNDGNKDLITGEYAGYLRVYLNTNTDEDPQFNGYFRMQVNGVEWKAVTLSEPNAVDWNNDGLFDVLCHKTQSKIVLMLNSGTPGNPVFLTEEYLQDGTGDLMGGNSTPITVDWNRDGKKDLIMGNSGGNLKYWDNKGTDSDPVFDGFVLLSSESGVIDAGIYARPDAVDWDNDGELDLIVGETTGHVTLFRAVGPLFLSANEIPENTGAVIDMALDAGADNANRNYLILGSVTGTEPGTALPGGYVTLPLNWDPFTDLVLTLANSVLFSSFMGKLDGNGTTGATLTSPPLPGYAGLVMHFAYTLNNPFDFVSNAAAVEIGP